MNIGVIFAGGVGKRMRSKEKPKQFLEIYNKPIIVYTLEHFERNPEIDAVVISCVADWIPYLQEQIYKFRIEKVKRIVPGGRTGQLSIYNGLLAAREVAGDEKAIVLIHDGVRPLINSELLSKNIECVKRYGSAITAGIVKETIVIVDQDNKVEVVPSRENSRVAKAPQSFWLEDVLQVHKMALEEGEDSFIDSCTMMQHYGYCLYMVDGPYENIKITTPDDYYTMRAVLEAKENAQIFGLE
ncbi:MAG: 2-C-methyl-D-erythritol 4-phosphate cytidylyltransferase [Clostridiales bacterium]|nr:2-C-methyl-D-erythritol 4-phosphate cytidylyltransferase [Clostridiales bacterium]